jgi:hypothetical protein
MPSLALVDKADSRQSRARKEAARIRNEKIVEAKAAKSSKTADKGKGKQEKKRKVVEPESDDDDEDDDEDTRRLKKRMAAAMAQGDSEDSEMELSDNEDLEDDDEEDDDEEEEEEEDEEETGSFHTDSEDEEDEEEELDDDESERLEEEGPIDDKTRQLRARMQAMMEAAESRARGDAPSPPSKKSSLKKTKSTEKPKPVEEDEDAGYDLAPLSSFGKPLSAEVLRKAEEADKARLAKKAEQDAIAKAKGQQVKRTRKKRKVEPTTRVISYVTHPSCLKSTNRTERRRHYMSSRPCSAPISLQTHYHQSLNLG